MELTSEEIKIALKEKRIIPFFQPQYDAITEVPVSAEALARIIDESGNIISPFAFIPEAEKTELISEIDCAILDEVCHFLHERMLSGKPVMKIAINFSRRHVHEKDFISHLSGILNTNNIPHELIEVELTESVLIDEEDHIVEFVQAIRDAGFDMAIDDFGSGFSCLSFVKDINASVLKIDKSLLSANCENEKERTVLESIFLFAQRLHFTTITEGVETKEQLGFLRTCGCNLIQGYYFSRPLPEEDFSRICDTLKNQEMHEMKEDILTVQTPRSAMQILEQAVFQKFPLIIFSNLTRNSFYMMAYENFFSRSCPSTGVFSELIEHGTETMHPDDRKKFADTFDRENLLNAYGAGKPYVRLVTKQLGDDGIYRDVETVDYFVKNPSSSDVLVVTLCQNLEI